MLYIYSMEILDKLKKQYQNAYISLSDLEKIKLRNKNTKWKLRRIDKNLEQIREVLNNQYLEKEAKEVKTLLDDVKGFALDKEQKEVVLRDEQNTLVIAGAGSGKSLTIIGKVRYLVERKKIPLRQILCISFTNDATNSLKDTLKKYYNYNLPVYTFHKLALNIIQKNGGKVQIADDTVLEKTVENYLKYTIITEKEALKWICQHFFHNLKKKDDRSVNKSQSFPQKYKQIQKDPFFQKYYKIILTFIHLMKANQYKIEDIDRWISKSKSFFIWKTADTYLLLILKRICVLYSQSLKKGNYLDFDDLIEYAKILVESDDSLNYKYIIIDEYQDTSEARYCLIQAIIKKTNAKLIAVGDDFQSIYRFTGCDLNIFLKFKNYFANSMILKIQTTYRNSQELIDVAGSFVMRNPRQISKNLISKKRIQKPIIVQIYRDLVLEIEKILDNVNAKTVFILGRNRRDIFPLLENASFSINGRNIIYQNRKELHIMFLTVHTSKGLESDVVIVLNMKNSIMGFPSQLVDDPILRYVNKAKDNYPYEEERRLFYVAITRTKNEVYLMTPQQNPSIFIKELIGKYKKKVRVLKSS